VLAVGSAIVRAEGLHSAAFTYLLRAYRHAVWIIVLSLVTISASVSANAVKPTEIRIGSVSTFADKNSPPAITARVALAYFAKVDASGGLNGRSIRLISYDYEGDRKKALDMTRKLVEVDHVALLFQMDGKINDAIMPYVRFTQIPEMYDADDGVIDAASLTRLQAQTLGDYILKSKPDSKIAILYESRNFTKALEGFYAGLGMEKARAMITNMLGSADYSGNRVARVSGSSADFLAIFGGDAFQAEIVKQMVGLKWRPIPVITDPQSKLVMPVGTIAATAHLSPIKLTTEEAASWKRFKSTLEPTDANSDFAVDGYLQSRSLIRILKQCDDELSRPCLNRAYTSNKDNRTDHLYVGIPIQFNGNSWVELRLPESER